MAYPSRTIPRPSWEYAQEPFDASRTFTVEGQPTRHMHTPLDEQYITEPFDMYVVGCVPPEEREVRDHIIVATLMRKQVSAVDFWWSQIFRETGGIVHEVARVPSRVPSNGERRVVTEANSGRAYKDSFSR